MQVRLAEVGVTLTVGVILTVTVTTALATQLLASVTETMYAPALIACAFGILIDALVEVKPFAPDHK